MALRQRPHFGEDALVAAVNAVEVADGDNATA